MSRQRLDRLLAAAELVARDRIARLSDIDLALGLIAEERERLSPSEAFSDAAVFQGSPASLWERWRETRLRELQMREAALRARREAARNAAGLAVGRREVVRTLSARRSKRGN